MRERPVGLWLIGACGGVGTTIALGLAALQRGLMDTTGLVTALPQFAGLDLDRAGQIVVGGHDIRQTTYRQAAREFHDQSGVFEASLLEACAPDLDRWTENVRPGTVYNAGPTITRLADLPEAHRSETARSAIDRIQADLQAFRTSQRLEQVVVLNVASTEAPFELTDVHEEVQRLLPALEKRQPILPASALYAWAALDLGLPYVNFTPSLGASFPAAEELAHQRKTVFGGKDGKTGETLMKTVLAPMFADRNLRVLSWVGHNIFGNRDGLVLDDPENKASKVKTKEQVLTEILGYKPQSHVSIEYIESLGDWKTAWDTFADFSASKCRCNLPGRGAIPSWPHPWRWTWRGWPSWLNAVARSACCATWRVSSKARWASRSTTFSSSSPCWKTTRERPDRWFMT
jgi:myo-inositol-1-phosphate synthase